jgi:hypothetical protein
MARMARSIVDGNARYELVLRLPDEQRSPQDLARTLIDTPAGRIARVQHRDGGGDRRPQPDRPRERPAPHRRLRQHRWLATWGASSQDIRR